MTDTIMLYHGSPDASLAAVEDRGIFGGIFAASEQRAAASHGPHVYVIELDEDDICTQQHLDYHADPDAIETVLVREGAAWENVIDGEPLDDPEDDWDAQRVRGLVARALGFAAVECRDEHGTTYLVLPGAKLEKL